MLIRAVNVQNFRGFEAIELDLHPEVTLLVGENGTGKTSFFDLLTMIVGLALESAGAPGSPPRVPSGADVRHIARTVGRPSFWNLPVRYKPAPR